MVVKDKALFELNSLNFYFTNKKANTSTGDTIDLDTLVLYDESDNFWLANCTKYYVTDEINLINFFKSQFENTGAFLNSSVKNRVIEAFKQYGRERYLKLNKIPADCICYNNAIVYLGNGKCPLESTLIAEDPEKTNYTEDTFNYFMTNPIPYDYDPRKEYKCPKIHELFVDWVGKDKAELLYDLIAYCVYPGYPINRIFILYGSGRNGKSTFMKILNKVIGVQNICASDLKTLTETPFGTATLYKKLVCYIGETDGHKLENTSILKRLTGEDLVSAQNKNKPLFEFVNYAKLIITTNTIPQTTDKSIGHLSRYIIIDFKKRYDEKRDVFSEIPESEFCALANICADRLKRILSNRGFNCEPTTEEKIKLYEEKSNPFNSFFRGNIVITNEEKDYIFTYDLLDKYNSWLLSNGYGLSATKKWLSQQLADKEIQSDRKQIWVNGESKRYYAYIGITWKTEPNFVSDDFIFEEKEYTKEEIIKFIRSQTQETIPDMYTDDQLIKIFKKQAKIYEPRNGIYKLTGDDL